MNILTEPLNNISYLDVKNFVKENHPEGVQLDYKELFPDKEKLSQLVAAFANTRGGLIIIGVGENRTNGRPTKADGIDDGRHDEFVAQVLGNISPIPAYEFHKTDEQGGKVFVLIRIFEGSETPYYPHNDSNIWIRTGSIKKSVEIASPEHIDLLFRKTERAEHSRTRNKNLAQKNYEAFLRFAEIERQKERENEKQEYLDHQQNHEDGNLMEPFESRLPGEPLGSDIATLTILLQPYYPHGQMVRPLETESIIFESEASNEYYSFPRRRESWLSIQEGMLQFLWSRLNGSINCQQVFANGLVYSCTDVLRNTTEQGRHTLLSSFVSQLYIILRGTNNVLNRLGYQGTLVGEMTVDGLEGVNVVPAVSSSHLISSRVSIFNSKSWPIEISTTVLSDEKALRKWVVEISKDIHWTFQLDNHLSSHSIERFESERFFMD